MVKTMTIQELEKIIADSLDDFKLSQDEKYIFRDLADTLEEDQLRFIRNKAFDLARPYIEIGGANAVLVLNWLDRVVKSIQPLDKTDSIKPAAYFSPGNTCKNKIISLLKEAKQSINICVFTISDNDITQSILDAHKRGVDVSIISDNDKANDRGSDIAYLADQGLTVTLDNSPHHMHHKFAIFDKRVLLNGSFNWTRSASKANEENITVSGDSNLIAMFNKQFDYLKDKLHK